MEAIKTEFPFTLPVGFVDDDGMLLREGVMRLSTAADEIAPLADMRVRSNEAYSSVIVLSRVIVKLGHYEGLSTHQVERFFSEDFNYLLRLFNDINHVDADPVALAGLADREVFPGNVEALPSRMSSMKR